MPFFLITCAKITFHILFDRRPIGWFNATIYNNVTLTAPIVFVYCHFIKLSHGIWTVHEIECKEKKSLKFNRQVKILIRKLTFPIHLFKQHLNQPFFADSKSAIINVQTHWY
jgi:hypothetical protein